jgi:photosystem II stability/assembly factor-like uncharacterized protein
MRILTFKLFIIALLLSTNAIAQWTNYSVPEQFYPSNTLQKIGTRLWCAGNHGIYTSDDNGTSWVKAYNGPLCTASSAFRKIYYSGSVVWVTMDDGFFATLLITRDNGLSWQQDTLSNYIYTRNYNGYYSISIIKDSIYAQTSQSGFPSVQHNWKKNVNDTMWIEYSGINYQSGFNSAPFACYPGNGIWFVDFGANFYSTTNGQSFTQLNISPALAVHYIKVFNNKLFVSGLESATSDSISLISSDNGVTWSKITTFAPSTKITFLAANGNDIVASDNKGRTHISHDNAVTWTLQTIPAVNFTSLEQIGGQFFCTEYAKDSVYRYGNSTGVSNLTIQQIEIFPNPVFENTLQIKLPSEIENKPLNINIYDMLGRNLKSIELKPSASVIKISLQELQTGNYILQILANQTKYFAHFVKQ